MCRGATTVVVRRTASTGPFVLSSLPMPRDGRNERGIAEKKAHRGRNAATSRNHKELGKKKTDVRWLAASRTRSNGTSHTASTRTRSGALHIADSSNHRVLRIER